MTSVVPPGQWRDEVAYRAIVAGGRSALAWELLRRDPNYVAAFRGPSNAPSRVVTANAASSSRWGLHFPD